MRPLQSLFWIKSFCSLPSFFLIPPIGGAERSKVDLAETAPENPKIGFSGRIHFATKGRDRDERTRSGTRWSPPPGAAAEEDPPGRGDVPSAKPELWCCIHAWRPGRPLDRGPKYGPSRGKAST